MQKADGIEMTIVNGQVALENGESTGVTPGNYCGNGRASGCCQLRIHLTKLG